MGNRACVIPSAVVVISSISPCIYILVEIHVCNRVFNHAAYSHLQDSAPSLPSLRKIQSLYIPSSPAPMTRRRTAHHHISISTHHITSNPNKQHSLSASITPITRPAAVPLIYTPLRAVQRPVPASPPAHAAHVLIFAAAGVDFDPDIAHSHRVLVVGAGPAGYSRPRSVAARLRLFVLGRSLPGFSAPGS